MSLYYRHLLIATPRSFSPPVSDIVQFISGLRSEGAVSDDASIGVSAVTSMPGRIREVNNPFTGEKLAVPMPTRKSAAPRGVSLAADCISLLEKEPEYDVVINCQSEPRHPPLDIDYMNGVDWQPFVPECTMEIRCRVRKNPVHVAMLRSEDELSLPPDPASYRPYFDEDCAEDYDGAGVFIHPDCGPRRIPSAGCARFWVEFRYGGFVFPRLNNNSLDLLSASVIQLARDAFGTDFVQAAHWG